MTLLPRRLNNRMTLLVSIILCVTGILSGWMTATRQSDRLLAAMSEHSSVMVGHFAENCARLLILQDYAELEAFLLNSAELPNVIRLQVCEPDGRIVGDVRKEPSGKLISESGIRHIPPPSGNDPSVTISGEHLIFWYPVKSWDLLGWLRADFSLASIKRAQAETWRQSLLLAMLWVACSAAMILLVLRPTALALKRLTQFARGLNECKGTEIKVRHSAVEIEELEGSLNYASGQLFAAEQQLISDRERLRESEERYRRLLDTVHEGIWVIDADAVTTFVNPRMAEILGYLPEEMTGRSLFAFMDEQGRVIAENNLERRRKGIKERHDFEFITKDGRRIYTRLETGPILDDAGEYAGSIAAVADITEQRLADEALRESEAKLKEAQRMAHIGYWERNLETGSVTLSEEACRIFGIPPQNGFLNLQQWHRQWQELIHPEDRPLTARAAAEALREGPPYDVEYRVVRSHGEIRIVHSFAEVFRDESGRPLRMVGTMQDITERKQAEEVLTRLNEELEQRVKQRTAELEEKNRELERMNKLFVGRELRMVELKERLRELETRDQPDGKAIIDSDE